MGRTAVRSLLLLLGLVLVGLPLGSAPAAAHGSGGPGPDAHVARVLALDPPLTGLLVTVIEAGARLRIDNGTGAPADVLPADGAARTTEPVVAPGATARWVDPRVRAAAADPVPAEGRRDWAIPLRVGEQVVTVRGEQTWPQPPPAALWWLGTLLTAVAAALIGTRAVTRPGWAPALAVTALLVAAAHAVHVLGSALIIEGHPLPGLVYGAAGPALLGWPLAAVGAALTLARRPYGPLLCALSGALFALVSAFSADAFSSAVLPFAGAADLDRLTVVLTLGGGVGLFVAGWTALARTGDAQPRVEVVAD